MFSVGRQLLNSQADKIFSTIYRYVGWEKLLPDYQNRQAKLSSQPVSLPGAQSLLKSLYQTRVKSGRT